MTTAASVDETRRQLEQELFDLVIADPQIRNESGSDAASVCRESDPSLTLLKLVPDSLLEPQLPGKSATLCDSIAKPVRIDDLLAAIERALDSSRLRCQARDLRRKLGVGPSFNAIVGNAPRLLEQIERARALAATDLPVLIRGENGVGKELMAEAIHAASHRREQPLVTAFLSAEPTDLQLSVSEVERRLATIRRLPEPLRVFQCRELATQLIELRDTTLDLLARQRARLVAGHPKDAAAGRMQNQLLASMSLADVLFLELDQLSHDDPRAAFGFDDFCASYCDEIVQIIARHADEPSALPMSDTWRCVRGRDIEVTYAPRNADFLQLGDLFGDCTARRTNKQLDQRIANIHWTVYAWLLDPFYRVMLVQVDGVPVLKAHLTPLIVYGDPVLAVDALEVVPALRNIIKGQQHRFLSQRLFSQRAEILQAAFEAVISVAGRMGIERVLVDKYSNAAWIRQAIDALPEEAYGVEAVEKPFGSLPVAALVRHWLGTAPTKVLSEIQHVDLGLMDQGLYPGNKQAGLLLGSPRCRGIRPRGP